MFGFGNHPVCSVCGKNKTSRKNTDGQPICVECQCKERVAHESVLLCPRDGTYMTKEVLLEGALIIDHCPYCRGMWFDRGELEQMVRDMQHNDALGLSESQVEDISKASSMQHMKTLFYLGRIR